MMIFFFVVTELQSTLISLTLTHLFNFVNEQNKHLILRIGIQEFSSENTQDILTSRGEYPSQLCSINSFFRFYE
jgi:hypothetical protein